MKMFVAQQRADRGEIMKVLRTDNGTEYINSEFQQFLSKHKIVYLRSAPHVPEQNGLVERDNHSLVELARSSLQSRVSLTSLGRGHEHDSLCPLPCSKSTGRQNTIREMVWTQAKYLTPTSVFHYGL